MNGIASVPERNTIPWKTEATVASNEKADTVKQREDSDFETRDRDYDHALKSRGDLRDWARAWETWSNDMAGEFRQAIKDHPRQAQKFVDARNAFADLGAAMFTAAGTMQATFDAIYNAANRSTGGEGSRGILTDATNPPPPPFGKGR